MAQNSQKTASKRGAGKPFKPGQSGNPGGRPKKDERLRRIEDMAKEHSEEALAALLDEAKNGKGAPRVAAATSLLDRAWGTPVKRQESGEPGDFDPQGMSDEELEAEAKELIADGVKLGVVKVIGKRKAG